MKGKKIRASTVAGRRFHAVESFGNVGEAIGPVKKGMGIFAVTRGQWSMIDAVLWCLDQAGPARISLWTWTIAEYEIQVLQRLMMDRKVTGGRLIIDGGARDKNSGIIADFKSKYGHDSVRYVRNHAKIATVENSKFRLLLRGSMNLNFNPRFENFDITEGGEDFDLVKRIEDELPILPDNCTPKDVYHASKVRDAFKPEEISMFEGVKVWAK